MNPPPPLPPIEPRRASDFRRELTERARAWIPSWGTQDAPGDFGTALIDIAARFSGEVAERLDRAGDKMARGLLDWLAVRGLAARPARMPVALKLTDSAQAPVLAPAPVRMQLDVDGASVVFETESDVQLVPGKLDRLVAVDPAADAYYLPPPGLTSLDPLVPQPVQWRLRSFAAGGATTLQLDPPLGLVEGMQLDIADVQYLVTAVTGDLVTIDPPLKIGDGLAQDATVDVVSTFAPFAAGRRNEQRHSLYLGHDDLLNLEAATTLAVRNAQSLLNVDWQYWGKLGDGDRDRDDWQALDVVGVKDETLQLRKPKGAVNPTRVGTVQSRWIRATTPHLDGTQPLLSADDLAIAINPASGALACPAPADIVPDTDAAVTLDGFANTTPLVLNALFHPLGREPRQFDAFYLGSAEVFSKPRASVSMCFEMADPTLLSFSVLRTGWWQNRVLAGVGRDRALHLFVNDSATGNLVPYPGRPLLQPPLPSTVSTTNTTTVALDPQPAWRLPTWSEAGINFHVAVAAGNAVWIWKEMVFDPTHSGWRPFATLSAPVVQNTPIAGLVYIDDPAFERMCAVREGKLFTCGIAGGSWTEIDTRDDMTNASVKLQTIASVVNNTTKFVDGVVGVADDDLVYSVDSATGACHKLAPTTVDRKCIPAARRVGVTLYVIAAVDDKTLVTVSPVSGASRVIDANAEILGGSLELAVTEVGKVFALASVRIDGETHLAVWGALDAPVNAELFLSTISPAIGLIGGAPTVLDRFIVAPGTQGDALVANWTPSALISGTGTIGAQPMVPATFLLALNDIIAMDGTTTRASVVGYPTAIGNEALWPMSNPFPTSAIGKTPLAFRVSNTTSAVPGTFLSANSELQLALNDHHLSAGSIVLMTSGASTPPVLYTVASVDATGRLAKLNNPPAIPDQTPVTYWRAENMGGRFAPTLAVALPDNLWDAAILATQPILFPTGVPSRMTGKAFRLAVGNNPALIVLDAPFTTLPNNGRFLINGALGAWRRSLGDASANPELAWEYWNGTTWWTLGVTRDETLNLKSTGLVAFTVPANLAPTEVAGKKNHWIRARLVGGDYGREQVKVKVKDLGDGVTEQTVERAASEVRAPTVLALRLQYESEPVRPTWVLTEDSGSIRDQSDANRTDGAMLEAFVPLSVTLQRLQRGGQAAAKTDEEDCECDPCRAAQQAEDDEADDDGAGTSRALFLGFDARLFGTPVNVLLVVAQEQPHDGFAPLAVDVVSGDRFEPLIVQDTTRALGESGLLSLSFPVAPKPATLFGQTRTWLRLRPSRIDPALPWQPNLRGAYLNTVWASATESLTREPLGSSDGRPMLTVRVARPPLVHDSLELRVREPLGEEERAALIAADPDKVRSDVVDLPGDWVRWTTVRDTADCGPDDRVFALDEALGELQFGDGRHGMIPPIGRDNVVAFRYARTEPPAPDQTDAPANRVQARMPLNLVTPVESVEAAIAADQAAGGAPPETDARVLRFGYARLRHRGRAVTCEDFEDLALQSQVDIAQARCFARNGRVRLVVAMRDGAGPSAAQSRALRRLLLTSALPAMAAEDALTIASPRARALRIALRLSVADLADAGRVANASRRALAGFFDAAGGGVDGRGWPLGALPSEDDVAYALDGIDALESIDDIRLELIDANSAPLAWPARLPADALVQLGADAVRVDFTPVEARDEANA